MKVMDPENRRTVSLIFFLENLVIRLLNYYKFTTISALAMTGFIEEFLHNCLHGDVEPFTLGMYNSSAIVSLEFSPTFCDLIVKKVMSDARPPQSTAQPKFSLWPQTWNNFQYKTEGK